MRYKEEAELFSQLIFNVQNTGESKIASEEWISSLSSLERALLLHRIKAKIRDLHDQIQRCDLADYSLKYIPRLSKEKENLEKFIKSSLSEDEGYPKNFFRDISIIPPECLDPAHKFYAFRDEK